MLRVQIGGLILYYIFIKKKPGAYASGSLENLSKITMLLRHFQ